MDNSIFDPDDERHSRAWKIGRCWNWKKVKIERQAKSVNNDFKYVEELLREKLDTKVKIKDKKIEIAFTNVADLNRILEVLNVRE